MLCDEIRHRRHPIIFRHVSDNASFAPHPTPKKYGCESYISISMVRDNGSFHNALRALRATGPVQPKRYPARCAAAFNVVKGLADGWPGDFRAIAMVQAIKSSSSTTRINGLLMSESRTQASGYRLTGNDHTSRLAMAAPDG
ncbi:MAG: hypothetical protein ABI767_12435 [Rhodanobacter sp.]